MTDIFCDPEDRRIINQVLSKHPYAWYAFGSRVKGTHRQYSDLDVCYMQRIPSHELVEIEGEFEDSDLTFKVDFVDFQNCSEEFQQLIQSHMIPLTVS